MDKLCDFCLKREATLQDSSIVNNCKVNYVFCEECYKNILLSGKNVHDVMYEKLTSIGKVCRNCGCTLDEFKRTGLLGCSECYNYMREAVYEIVQKAQGATSHKGKKI